MRELGVEKNPNYKIVCYLDSLAMITVRSPTYGVLEIKPLAVIWVSNYHHNDSVIIN